MTEILEEGDGVELTIQAIDKGYVDWVKRKL